MAMTIEEIRARYEGAFVRDVFVSLTDNVHGDLTATAVEDLAEFSAWVRDENIDLDETIARVKPRTIEVGRYVSSYEGEAIALFANCSTQVWMDEDGYLVFEGRDSDGEPAKAVLNVSMLLSACSERRAEMTPVA